MSESTANFVQTLGEGIHVKRPANDVKAVESFTFVGETAIASQLGVASHIGEALAGGASLFTVSAAARAVLVEAIEDFIRSRAAHCEMLRLRREMKAESALTWTVASFNDRPAAAPAPKKRKPKSQRGSSRRGTGR